MSVTLIVIILIVLIILIVVCKICNTLQVLRYFRFKSKSHLRYLDNRYSSLPRVNSSEKVVISLTTIPDRMDHLFPTIGSLLDQTVRVDEIALNIPRVSRKGIEYRIPEWMKDMKSITIHRVKEDEGPATKLLPVLRRESDNTRIIVVDDDNIYHSQTIELLVRAFENHLKNGDLVAVTHYGVILEPDGTIPPFKSISRVRTMLCGPKPVDILQGCHGFIVTPRMFPEGTLDLDKRPDEAVSVDDIWFSCWLHLNNIPIYCLGSTYKHVPLVNFGEVNKTPKLVNGENKGFIRDQKIVNWFMDKGYVPVTARPKCSV